MEALQIPDTNRRWDCISLGEVMLRLDPGEGRIHATRKRNIERTDSCASKVSRPNPSIHSPTHVLERKFMMP